MAFTGQWQSPPPATISPTNTITLSESERNSNNPFPIFPRLNCHLLLLSSPFVSLPPFHVVQLYQGNSLERVGKLRVSKRFASSYLSLSLCLSLLSLTSPVTIKINKIFDTKKKRKKDTYEFSTIIFVVSTTPKKYISSYDDIITFYFCSSIEERLAKQLLDRTIRIERYAVKMRGLLVIMGRELMQGRRVRESCEDTRGRLPSRHFRAGGSSGFLSCKIRELRPNSWV